MEPAGFADGRVRAERRGRQRERGLEDGDDPLVLSLTRGMTSGNNLTSLCFNVLYKIRVISPFSSGGYERVT